jgi:hypothetical protein
LGSLSEQEIHQPPDDEDCWKEAQPHRYHGTRGRVSGKVYRVPLLAAAYKDGYMFALTYGTEVDWYKNILHSREGNLTVNGRVFHLVSPENVLRQTGQSAFGQPVTTILRVIDIRNFFFMHSDITRGKANDDT